MRRVDRSKIRDFLLGVDSDSYTLGLSVASALAFGFAAGGVTFLDSHYVNVIYGLRTYRLGYFVLIFCLPEFYLTYRLTSIRRSLVHVKDARLDLPVTRAICALLVPMVVAFALSPNFLPEFPHIGLMVTSFVAGAFSCTGVYLHNLRGVLDFGFVKDKTIDETARIEMLKLTHSTWSDALKLLVTIFLGIAGLYVIYGYTLSLQGNLGNQVVAFWKSLFGLAFTVFYTIFLILGILVQLLGGMADIQDQLLNIRK